MQYNRTSMNVKIKIALFFVLALMFSLVYTFIIAIPLKGNIFFEAVSATVISNEEIKKASEEDKAELFPFLVGKRFGYFNAEGKIVHSESVPYEVTLSRTAFALYQPQNTKTEVFSPQGKVLGRIQSAGFVHLTDSAAYVFTPGGNAVTCYSLSGEKKWHYEHTAIVSAFNSSPVATVIGFSDGKIVCIDNDGTVLFDLYPGGSKYEVIVGAAISTDGTKIACISGVDRQRVVLIQSSAESAHYKIVYHQYLSQTLRRQAFMRFDSSGDFLLFELAKGIALLDCPNEKLSVMDEEGVIVDVGVDLDVGLFTVLMQKDARYTLSLIRQPANILAQTSFEAKNAYFVQDKNHIFLALDDKLIRVDIHGLDARLLDTK